MKDDYLPARMINEFVYCPRLFYLMHVERQFADNEETIDGQIVHRRVDAGSGRLDRALEDLDPAICDLGDDAEKKPAATKKAKSPVALPLFGDDPDVDTSTPDGDSDVQSKAGHDELGSAFLDAGTPPGDSDAGSTIHSRSVTLSSESVGVIAKLDLVEKTGNEVVPVDYKRGRPRREADGSLGAWMPEKVQICLQALVLRDNGYRCNEGVLYFNETRQRVVIPIDDSLIASTDHAISGARGLVDSGSIPRPLVDSPKCPKCSLVNICLPEETRRCFSSDSESTEGGGASQSSGSVRMIVTPRDARRPLYLNTQGLRVGKQDDVLRIKDDMRVVQEVRLREINQINLHGSIQMTSQAVQTALQLGIPIMYFSSKNWFYGMATGLGLPNVNLRRQQFRLADQPAFCLSLAQQLVCGKIQNSRTLLMRNHTQPPAEALRDLKRLAVRAMKTESLASLLGIEGAAARIYFQSFAGMIKVDVAMPTLNALAEPRGVFDFRGRNRRPPRDPVNALLSLAYSLLVKDLTIAATSVGLDPHVGFYHQVKPGKPALSLDMMEPFRPLIADSVVISAINNGMVTGNHFVEAGDSVTLSAVGRKHFFHAYEQRMDQLVTHPLFGYRVSYRRLLEIQTRLLGRYLSGEIDSYPVFTTR